jgi:hypothetical protein
MAHSISTTQCLAIHKSSDPEWDERADLNNDNVLNILGIIIIGIDFGKTAFG